MKRPDDRRRHRAVEEGPPVELTVTALAAGGDGVARDDGGRVTFVARTAPGDRITARLTRATKSFAHGELVEVRQPSARRVTPPCPHFVRGCGGCQWQHVDRAEQLLAKQTNVHGALRKLTGLVVHEIEAPAPPLGWRRRARFHVAGGNVGLFALESHRLVAIDHCPQLEPRLDAALGQVRAWSPPDGELALVVGHAGDVAIGVGRPWKAGARLIGKAAIRGVIAGDATYGDPVIEIEPGLWGSPWDFAQASAGGNAALIARTREALGQGGGRLVELYAGSGNITRVLVGDGWQVTALDVTSPARPTGAEHVVGPVEETLAAVTGTAAAIVLDPPRTGAPPAVIDGIARLAPRVIAYVSCDVSTLARDAERLTAAGYRATDAWPIDVMPQTSHVEVVLRLVRA